MSLRDYETVMKAVSDPTRVRILKVLEDGELCVCQIVAILPLAQSTVSKHLFLLKAAGLIRDRRDRKWIHYSLDRKNVSPYVRHVLRNLTGWLADDPVVRKDRERTALARAVGPLAICERRMTLPASSQILSHARRRPSKTRKRGKEKPGPRTSPTAGGNDDGRAETAG